MSATTQSSSGWLCDAASIMAGELSSPTTRAVGHRRFRMAVLLPAPHPRSITDSGDSSAIRDARSTAGRVRSSPNHRYALGSQPTTCPPVERAAHERRSGASGSDYLTAQRHLSTASRTSDQKSPTEPQDHPLDGCRASCRPKPAQPPPPSTPRRWRRSRRSGRAPRGRR